MALGAHRGTVYQLIVGEAARLVAVGVTLGILCAMVTSTLMRGMFFGVQAWDAPTLVTVAAVLGISALTASYVPARRAASVNPIDVLRGE